jgi:hypothetical protein
MTCRGHADNGFAGTKKPETICTPEDACEMESCRDKTQRGADKKRNVVVVHGEEGLAFIGRAGRIQCLAPCAHSQWIGGCTCRRTSGCGGRPTTASTIARTRLLIRGKNKVLPAGTVQVLRIFDEPNSMGMEHYPSVGRNKQSKQAD